MSDDQSETDEEEHSHGNANESIGNFAAQPRDHAYLPTSHPLHTPFSLLHGSYQSSSRASNIQELPVLELPGILLFPGSVFPLRFSPSDSAWMEYLGRQITSSRQSPGQAGEVRLGILTAKPPRELERAASLDRRRHSWTRQAFGPDRLRRLSMQLIRELGNLDELSENEEDDETDPQDRSMPENTQPEEMDGSSTVPPPPYHPTRNNVLGCQKDRCGYIGRIGTIVTVMSTHGDEAGNNTDSSSVWRRVNDDGKLVLTTLATSRFRILGYSTAEDEAAMYQRAVLESTLRRSFTASVPIFIVEVMDERQFAIPTVQRPISSVHLGKQKRTREDDIISSFAIVTPFPEFIFRKIWPWRLISLIRQEMASSQTLRAFLHFLPRSGDEPSTGNSDAVQSDSSGTVPSMTFKDETEEENDPVKLSFWLASNLPLPEDDKYRLLEMHSAVERLEYIYKKIKERTEPLICCLCCGLPLSRASYMFTVGGAEGTTGAYVNEHGFVHQTITVRRLLSLGQNPLSTTSQSTGSDDESDVVFFSGGPETKDSWFPGYSWTIMSCSLCDSHLGWKFRRVQRCREEKASNERPELFYGLSGASVTIAIPQ